MSCKPLKAAAEEPQEIYDRGKLVATVVGVETFEVFRQWQHGREQRSIGERFAELRRICAEEDGWELPSPDRQGRSGKLL